MRKQSNTSYTILFVLCALLLAGAVRTLRAANEHVGLVTLGGLAVPGATVTASQGDKRLVATTDVQGVYRFTDLADGTWSLKVEMLGFTAVVKEITAGPQTEPEKFELTLMPFAEIAKMAPPPAPVIAPTAAAASPTAPQRPAGNQTRQTNGTPATNSNSGFQRAGVNAAPAPPQRAAAEVPEEPAPASQAANAADGLLVNGSVNNGAASPFAQPAAFGNNRRRQGSLYTYAAGIVTGNSLWDARPYSFSSVPAQKPDYNNVHALGTFQGPIPIPGLSFQKRPNVFVGYQRTDDTFARTRSAIVPTLRERTGDFSQSVDAFGNRVQVNDPLTGQPFANGVIPASRISPQAAALLQYYPVANLDADGLYNFQRPVITDTTQDSVQSRVTQPVNNRNTLFGTVSYQRTDNDTLSLFQFADDAQNTALDATVTWSHRVNQFFNMRPRYQFTRTTNSSTPYFANLTNVSGDAGISGNNQSPENWGPPTLSFSSGFEPLTDALHQRSRTQVHVGGAEAFWAIRRHNLTLGGDVRRHLIDIRSQQDPRGAFSFTGMQSGSDFGDFLLGLPSTASIAFGNADKFFRANSYDAYVTDDLRLSPSFTLMAGVRWEYESPITESFGRLVNLDIANNFSAISPVVASDPVGSLTGTTYDESLMKADKLGIQPRLAVAWRPVPGSSLIVRAGYGIYRNTNVYLPLATMLAQQPPLSKSFSMQNTKTNPFTLANAFAQPATVANNTFAIDPELKVGSSQTWQASVQRDLPASLTVTATYMASKGSNLMQEILPNTYAPGGVNPCPTCPAGFVFLSSNGSSMRNAGQVQVRRRLRNGFTAQVQYTLAKSTDDATAFSGASLSSTAIAQNWLDLDAERAPSSFDQRHQVAAQFQYTTGVGVGGGALLNGIKGSLFKGWTVLSQITTGSGLPLTPLYFTPIPGTGFTGIRANLTGADTNAPSGYYLNPQAYEIPAAGQWGTAGRNSVRGPAQFSMNAGISRTFTFNNRFNLDWRIDSTNVLNRVVFTRVNTLVGSPQFGLPNDVANMRKVQSTLRLRF